MFAVDGNRLGVEGLDLYDIYQAAVFAMWEGKEITYEMIPTRPYTRNAKNPHGHLPALKKMEAANKDQVVKEFFAEFPDLKTPQNVALAKVRSCRS